MAEAVAQYQRLAERSPAAATGAKTMMGMLKETQSDRPGARSAYEEAVRNDPRAGVAANNLAWIYAEEGRLDEAVRFATLARDEMGRRPEAEDALGWVLLKKGLTAQALASFERARDRAPHRAIYHYHIRLTHMREGNNSRARIAFDKAPSLDPKLADAVIAQEQLSATLSQAK